MKMFLLIQLICEKSSMGRDKAGVPLKGIARLAFCKIGKIALVRAVFKLFKGCDSS